MLHTFKYPQSIITPFVSFLEAQRPVNESDALSTKWKPHGFQEKISLFGHILSLSEMVWNPQVSHLISFSEAQKPVNKGEMPTQCHIANVCQWIGWCSFFALFSAWYRIIALIRLRKSKKRKLKDLNKNYHFSYFGGTLAAAIRGYFFCGQN